MRLKKSSTNCCVLGAWSLDLGIRASCGALSDSSSEEPMSDQAARWAASYSKGGLVLSILVERNDLSLRELVLCFISCKAFRELLDCRGFCIGTAWLCACLESGRSPTEILSRLRSARRSLTYERPLSRVDQVWSFLTKHEHYGENYGARWAWAWAQLLYQEPDGGLLCEGVKKMRWMLKHRLIKEQHKTMGYYPGLCTLEGHSEEVSCVAWSPDGKLLASGNQNIVRIWDVATGKEAMAPLTGHSAEVYSVAWSPDGKLIASGGQSTSVIIWEVCTGKKGGLSRAFGWPTPLLVRRLSMTQHEDAVLCVAWSPDGKLLASGSADESISIWDVSAGKEEMAVLWGHSQGVCSVAWSPDGKLVASCSGELDVKIWDISEGEEAIEPIISSWGVIDSVAWSPEGELVASSRKGETVVIWDIATSKKMAMIPPLFRALSLSVHGKGVCSVVLSPDGKQVASGNEDSLVRVWDVATGKEAIAFMGSYLISNSISDTVTDVAWSPDCKLVACGSGEHVWIWDVAAGKEAMAPLTRHWQEVHSVVWSPDGKLLASGSADRTIRIWDIATGKEAMGPLTHSRSVRSVTWSPDGKLVASGSDDGTVRIWDIATGKEVLDPLTGHDDAVLSVAWSPDGTLIASGSEDTSVIIWDVATCMEVMDPLFMDYSDMVWFVAWSPDSKLVASGYGFYDNEGGTVIIWDVATGEIAMQKNFSDTAVSCVAWSPDGKLIAAAQQDDTVIIWDVATGKEAMLTLYGSYVSWVDVGPKIRELGEQVGQASQDSMTGTGTYIVSAVEDTVLVYKVLGGRESGVEQVVGPVALFRCPRKLLAVSCRPPYISAGCDGGQVLLLEAPFLCEGPGY